MHYRKLVLGVLSFCAIVFVNNCYSGSFELQTNLGKLSNDTSSVPFKDLMMQSDQSVIGPGLKRSCPQTPKFDADGYPTTMAGDCFFRVTTVSGINKKYVTGVAGTEVWSLDPPLTMIPSFGGKQYPYKPGRYAFTYQGTADFSFGGDAANVSKEPGKNLYKFDVANPKDGIVIKVSNYGAAYPRNFHLFHIKDSDFKAKPFNENFLATLQPYSIIRFMNWQRANEAKEIYNSSKLANVVIPYDSLKTDGSTTTLKLDPVYASSVNDYYKGMAVKVNINGTGGQWPRAMVKSYDGTTHTLTLSSTIPNATTQDKLQVFITDFYNRTWASRTPVSPILQTSQSGVAYEYIIQLANYTHKHPWINVPAAADDSYVTQLVQLFNSKLDPDLKLYIEYTNETWDIIYPQFDYNEGMSLAMGLNKINKVWFAADAYNSYRTMQIFQIASDLLGEPRLSVERNNSRLVRVLSSQTNFPLRGSYVLDWGKGTQNAPSFGHAAHEYADMYGVSSYINQNLTKDKLDLTLDSVTQQVIFDSQMDMVDRLLFGDTDHPGVLRQNLMNAIARHIKIGQYEGGQGLIPPKTDATPLKTFAKLLKYNRSDDMYTLYKYNLEHWEDLREEFPGYVGNFSQFINVVEPSRYGFWGAVESSYQDLQTSPKFRALSEFANSDNSLAP